jgi:hypothetical protein
MMLLSEVLDIDVVLFMAPDARVKLSKDTVSIRPLKFLKYSHKNTAGPRKLFMRFKFQHFILLEPDGSKSRIMPGTAADEKHYLTGSHDVATGMCVSLHLIRFVRARCHD